MASKVKGNVSPDLPREEFWLEWRRAGNQFPPDSKTCPRCESDLSNKHSFHTHICETFEDVGRKSRLGKDEQFYPPFGTPPLDSLTIPTRTRDSILEDTYIGSTGLNISH